MKYKLIIRPGALRNFQKYPQWDFTGGIPIIDWILRIFYKGRTK